MCSSPFCFFFNDTATTEIYTLSLHDALPISPPSSLESSREMARPRPVPPYLREVEPSRSEEHTSELQSHLNLVCRLLLEKKKTADRSQSPSSRSALPEGTRCPQGGRRPADPS